MPSQYASIVPPGAGLQYFVLGYLAPEQQSDLPRVGEMAARYGLELLPSA
jgi:hypothetical protein